MQSVTIEKGQHLTLRIDSVEEVPSKNPSWDSRWKFTGKQGTSDVSTYIGNKALTQQLGRKGMSSPNELVGQTWTFERTVEGYLNLIPSGGKTKTEAIGIAPTTPSPRSAVVGSPAAMPFDQPADDEENPAEVMARKQEEIRQEKRKRVGEDIAWAFTQADHFITLAIQAHNVEYTPEVLRAVVALAATIHISYKEAR